MTAAEIREQWRSVLKAGARNMLDHFLAVYPVGVTRAELAEVTGNEIRAADVFFLGATEVMIHPVSPHE